MKYSFDGLTGTTTDENPPVSDTTIFDESGMGNNSKIKGTIYKTGNATRAATHWLGVTANAIYNDDFAPLQVFTYSA